MRRCHGALTGPRAPRRTDTTRVMGTIVDQTSAAVADHEHYVLKKTQALSV